MDKKSFQTYKAFHKNVTTANPESISIHQKLGKIDCV